MNNGFIQMQDKDYHSLSQLSSSLLKAYMRSPAHYKAMLESPKEQTDAQRLGSLIHKAVLEPQAFESMIYPEPEHDLKTKAGREETQLWADSLPLDAIVATSRTSLDSFKKQIGDRQLVKISELVMIDGIKKACHKNDYLSMFLNDSKRIVEHAGFGTISDVPVRIKPDLLSNGWLLDLKTTTNAHPDVFKWDIKKYQYDLQLEMYAMVTYQITGIYPQMGIIAVEKEKPHGISLFKIESSISRQNLIKEACFSFKLDSELDNWPCYSPDFITYDMDM